ncbi:hypothetical protein FF38_01959 [Lucilia cuprina]|uniref:Uncharacterized protein n=1 Tax=Lucilia cuprina TaxID=7375 RepID=A0A0L0CRC8_LUCCU|nr:hypothetical protein FF38_01959 [Lucilia cuprina]
MPSHLLTPENADKIVLATVLLHNFLILNNDKMYFNSQNHEEIGQEFLEDVRLLRFNRSTTEAFDLGVTLKEFLFIHQ